jgi:hypothetical protein
MKKYDEALKEFNDGIEYNKENYIGYNRRGILYK